MKIWLFRWKFSLRCKESHYHPIYCTKSEKNSKSFQLFCMTIFLDFRSYVFTFCVNKWYKKSPLCSKFFRFSLKKELVLFLRHWSLNRRRSSNDFESYSINWRVQFSRKRLFFIFMINNFKRWLFNGEAQIEPSHPCNIQMAEYGHPIIGKMREEEVKSFHISGRVRHGRGRVIYE